MRQCKTTGYCSPAAPKHVPLAPAAAWLAPAVLALARESPRSVGDAAPGLLPGLGPLKMLRLDGTRTCKSGTETGAARSPGCGLGCPGGDVASGPAALPTAVPPGSSPSAALTLYQELKLFWSCTRRKALRPWWPHQRSCHHGQPQAASGYRHDA